MKKIVSLVLIIVLVAALSIGGTLAYLTATDKEVNTFTVGGVKIDIIEQQRNKDKTALEAFENDKILMPIVGSAQGEKDEFGQPVAANYCDKMVSVKNTGKSDAYIRLFVAIPAVLDDGVPSFNASKNALHFNFGNYQKDGAWKTTYKTLWSWNAPDGSWYFFDTLIGDDGIKYNVYCAYYQKVLPAGATTEDAVSGLYLDKGINIDVDGNMSKNGVDLGWNVNTNKITMPVFAQAVQAAGFTSAEAAFAEAGLPANPWA